MWEDRVKLNGNVNWDSGCLDINISYGFVPFRLFLSSHAVGGGCNVQAVLVCFSKMVVHACRELR